MTRPRGGFFVSVLTRRQLGRVFDHRRGREAEKTDLDCQNEAIWSAIDSIAAAQDLSTSRLAIVSGSSSTVFNKSKRVDRRSGQRRWLTMEIVAKLLRSSNMTYAEFGALVDEKMGQKAMPAEQPRLR